MKRTIAWSLALLAALAVAVVLAKAGLRREGVQRQHVLKGDRFEDLDYYAILRQEAAPGGASRGSG